MMLPGFSAEASLYQSRACYLTGGRVFAAGDIVPAALGMFGTPSAGGSFAGLWGIPDWLRHELVRAATKAVLCAANPIVCPFL
jgi:hypothetical protein